MLAPAETSNRACKVGGCSSKSLASPVWTTAARITETVTNPPEVTFICRESMAAANEEGQLAAMRSPGSPHHEMRVR